MKLKKKISTLLTVTILGITSSFTVFAMDNNSIINSPDEGYVIESTDYDTAELVGIQPRATVVMNSWVQ